MKFESSNIADVGQYFYKVTGTADTGQTVAFQFTLTVDSGCSQLATITNSNAGDKTYIAAASTPALTYAFAFNIDVVRCQEALAYTVVCYTDNTYLATETCPTFVTLTGETFSVDTGDFNDAGHYFYDVAITTSFGLTDSFRYELTVTDGCSLSAISNTNPGDQDAILNSPVSWNLDFSLDEAHCGAVAFTYTTVCFTDATYSSTVACPSFVVLAGETFTASPTVVGDVGTFFFRVSALAATGQTDSVDFKLLVTENCGTAGITLVSPGDQTYAIASTTLNFNLVYGVDNSKCSPTFSYVETCYTDNSYAVTETCSSFITRAGNTFSVVTIDS